MQGSRAEDHLVVDYSKGWCPPPIDASIKLGYGFIGVWLVFKDHLGVVELLVLRELSGASRKNMLSYLLYVLGCYWGFAVADDGRWVD